MVIYKKNEEYDTFAVSKGLNISIYVYHLLLNQIHPSAIKISETGLGITTKCNAPTTIQHRSLLKSSKDTTQIKNLGNLLK